MKDSLSPQASEKCYEHPRRKATHECIGCGLLHCRECVSEGGEECLNDQDYHELRKL